MHYLSFIQIKLNHTFSVFNLACAALVAVKALVEAP